MNLNNTTLTARLDGVSTRMKLADVTGRAKNDLALIDDEIILVNQIDTDAKTLEIQRGYGGTQADEHANGAVVWIDTAEFFLQPTPSGYADEAKQIVTPRPAFLAKYHVPTLRGEPAGARSPRSRSPRRRTGSTSASTSRAPSASASTWSSRTTHRRACCS